MEKNKDKEFREDLKKVIIAKYSLCLYAYYKKRTTHKNLSLKKMCQELKGYGVYSHKTADCDIVHSVSNQYCKYN